MIDDIMRSDVGGRTLARFTRDLTADARAGRLEPVRCRDNEVARVIDILLRHGKNNPTLVGPAGVGKTAIADGLAQRIAAGNVPVSLRDVRLLSLDHVGLLAGTTYRGDYEERIRSLVAETMAAGDIILFIDELHNLIGQGTGATWRWMRPTCSNRRWSEAIFASSALPRAKNTSGGSKEIRRWSGGSRRLSCTSLARPRRWRF